MKRQLYNAADARAYNRGFLDDLAYLVAFILELDQSKLTPLIKRRISRRAIAAARWTYAAIAVETGEINLRFKGAKMGQHFDQTLVDRPSSAPD